MARDQKAKNEVESCDEKLIAAKNEVVRYKQVAEADRSALNAGLNLAFRNEELQREIAGLRKKKSQTAESTA
jgi:hypothetical protein